MEAGTHKLGEQFGNIIRDRRSQLGISQEELAERASLHRTYVADIERGARNPTLQSINRLAGALGISMSDLFSTSEKALKMGDMRSGVEQQGGVDILLVEDNPNDVDLTLRAFKKAQLTNRVYVVRDGEEALDFAFATGKYEERKLFPLPGVILLDLNLPKIDGREVLRLLKNDSRTLNISVVILTASDQDRDIAVCKELGAKSYILKPVDFLRLASVTPQLNFSWTLFAAGS